MAETENREYASLLFGGIGVKEGVGEDAARILGGGVQQAVRNGEGEMVVEVLAVLRLCPT
jgi:hypothetical protein